MSLADGIVAALALAIAHTWRRKVTLEPSTERVAGKPVVVVVAKPAIDLPTGFRTRGAFRAR
ncbi:MAG: hypothetical protein ABI867_34095 [Kofleriaceae bacterium]